MTEPALFAELRDRNIQVWVVGDDLQLDAPDDALTPELLERLRKHKGELLEFLRGPAALSFAQQRLWFLDQMEMVSTAYMIPCALRLEGALQAQALEAALASLVERHESLRTTFVDVEGRLVQIVSEEASVLLPVVEVGAEPERLETLMHEEMQRGFDLARGPLFRAVLYRVGPEEHVLLLLQHHIISDAWSVGVMLRELGTLYEDRVSGRESALPELPVQYRDFARWQREWLQGEALAHQLEYWRSHLAAAPQVLDLPTDRPRPPIESHRGANYTFAIPREVSRGLVAMSRREGVTLFMTLMAALDVLLWRYSGQEDLLVGIPAANRGRRELEGLIGLFVNTLVVRNDLSGDPTVRELLARVQERCLNAYAHQELPLETLVQELQPARDLSRNPLFQVMLNVQNATEPPFAVHRLRVTPVGADRGATHVDLTLYVQETPEGLKGGFEYATDLFERSTMERMARHWCAVLEAMVAGPGRRLSELPLLTEAERRQVLVEFNRTNGDYPHNALLQGLFDAQVERGPERTALRAGTTVLTYSELDARAARIGHVLRARGAGRGQRVGLCMERGADMLAAVLGILKSGAAYVPLDPAFPQERLRFMAEDAQLSLLVSTSALVGAFGLPRERQLLLDVDAATLALQSDQRLNPDPALDARPEDPAYVIYTSGSTGRPKGVVVPHRAVVNFLTSMARQPGLAADDVLVAVTTLSFDIAVLELQLPLTLGATVVIASREEAVDGEALVALLEKHRATVMQATPVTWRMLLEAGWAPKTPFKALVGGEALPKDLAEQLLARSVELWNMYGPTETTVWSTCARITDTVNGISIGKPIANTTAYILDARNNLCPIGVPGELCIGGDGVTLGYWNRPELTAERFIPDPYSSTPGARLYRTGDRARWRNDGTLEHLGRLDFQVKIRGYRIELGEIEAGIARHPAVKEVVVVAREDVPGDQRLVAYLVVEKPPAHLVEQLRAQLRAGLPDYMLPSAFVVLDQLPLTPNSKIDRKSLPAPERSGADEAAYVAPRTVTEEILADIWAEVLGIERVGIEENFFDLGGHSLLVMQVVSRVRQALSVELPLREFFVAPTIAGLSASLEALQAEPRPELAAPPLEAKVGAGPVELSFAQQRLWFLDQVEMVSTAYMIPCALRLEGALQAQALEAALASLVERHESLRTTFVDVEGRLVQIVSEEASVLLPVVEVGAEPERLETLMHEEMQRGFDLARGPLFRAVLYRVGPEEHVLLLLQHHIISDAWSVGVMLRELGTLYEDRVSGRESALPELPVQYRDFARWQREWLQGEALAHQLEYWRSHLAAAPQVLDLPTDRPRPPIESHRGANYTFAIPREVSRGLVAMSRREGVTLFMTLMAALDVLLWRYSGQEDLLVGIPAANRGRRELEGLIGLFVNTLVVRNDLSGDPTVRELLARVQERCLNAYAHQELPLETLVQELQPARDLSRNPLFQVMLNVQNATEPPFAVHRLRVTPVGADRGATHVDLTLYVQETPEGLKGGFEYATDLFERSTMERMARHWCAVLEAMVAGPGRRLSELPLLTEAERRQVLVEFNRTNGDYPHNALLQGLFDAQVERGPERTALRAGTTVLTYSELDARAARIGHVLRARGAGRGQRVGLCMERGADMLAAVLGILKSGAAYVPLDPAFPQERLRFMAEDAQLSLLVSTSALVGAFGLPRERQLLLDVDAATLALQSDQRLNPDPALDARPEDPAYVIYTSGSTGRPKGVVVPHRAVVNFLTSMARQPGLAADDVLVAVTTLSFDIAVLELQLPLTLGATVVIASREEAVDGEALVALLEKHRATVMQATPVTWRMLLEAGWAPKTPFKALVGGEALPKDLAEQLLARSVELWNMYGPTETTVWSTCARITDTVNGISIGKPIANTTAYILDARNNLCPIGVPGELCIGGDGVTLGYWNRPELTAERFIPDPYSSTPGARLYRTGDRARWRNDGTLEHLGRLDFQVKIRGYRIELGEIEAVLAEHPEVRQAAVHLWTPSANDVRLVACCVPTKSGVFAPIGLRKHLRSRLPEYMVPQHFMPVNEVPLTPNGKIDRRRLPTPVVVESSIGQYEAPADPVEAKIAEIWTSLIGPARPIGRGDRFFEMGGHSLLALRALRQMEQALGVKLDLRVLFQDSLAEIATRCRAAVTARDDAKGGAATRMTPKHEIGVQDRVV